MDAAELAFQSPTYQAQRSGISAAGAAIAAAVDDALGRTGAVRQLPITPNRLHALLAEPPAPER